MASVRWPWWMALSFLALAGCGDVWSGEPSFQTAILMPGSASTPQPVAAAVPQTCAGLLNAVPADTVSVPARDGCTFAMMSMIDLAYYEYRKNLRRLVDTGHAASDIIGIGLGSAGALVGGPTTKSILAAISAGVAGARGKIDADILYSNSITLIITQMDADRADWKSRILAQLSNTPARYTMYQAANDLLVYYEAGTFSHAVVSLDTHASANLSNCQAAVKNAQLSGGGGDTNCGPIPVVTPVPQDVDAARRNVASFVKKLKIPDQRKLSNSLGIPAAAQDSDVLGNILDIVDAARTIDQIDAIKAKIKSLFGKEL